LPPLARRPCFLRTKRRRPPLTKSVPSASTFPEATLVDLRNRINATRWPDKETVTDDSQGVPLATMQGLARYWASDYDWRKVEARLNALPQFTTEIDGVDIHFIHVRSKHEDALPLIVTHGRPGSIIEQLKIIDPLTNPTAHGAPASDAFHLVIPSMPGYGFSGKPTTTGWDPARIARAWVVLMKRLGYTRFVAQGGDWGSPRRRNCWAFTSTCPAPFHPKYSRQSRPATPPRRVLPMTSDVLSRRSRFRSASGAPMPLSWQRARKRCTESQTHRSVSPPG